MSARVSSPPSIPVAQATKDLRHVLRMVDRAGFVRLTKNGKTRYHIRKEISETLLLSRLKASVREYKAGKTRVLRSLQDF